jgi:hypothetical protein
MASWREGYLTNVAKFVVSLYNCDFFKCPVQKNIEFLTDVFHSGLLYFARILNSVTALFNTLRYVTLHYYSAHSSLGLQVLRLLMLLAKSLDY